MSYVFVYKIIERIVSGRDVELILESEIELPVSFLSSWVRVYGWYKGMKSNALLRNSNDTQTPKLEMFSRTKDIGAGET